MSFLCEFCNKIFSAKNNLYAHQKKAKFCLEKRGIAPNLIFCRLCNLGFIAKRQLERHLLKCTFKITNDKCDIEDVYKEKMEKLKTEKDNEILLIKEMYEKRISSLERIILSKINNKSNMLIDTYPLTEEYIIKQCENMSIEDFKSIKSLTSFLKEKILQERSICTDSSRKTIRYNDINNNEIVDKRGFLVVRKFIENIKKYSHLVEQLINDVPENSELIIIKNGLSGNKKLIEEISKKL